MGYKSKYTGAQVDAALDKANTALQAHQDISGKANIADLAKVATSGSYNDLTNKPTIPSAVTESTVSGWGFTKNTGTYSKPSTGIPNSDLANSKITISGTDVSLGGSITQSALRTALGLGSNAYTSTSYLSTTGTAAAATKLANKRTIWGQEFDGTANIAGDMTVPSTFIIKNASGTLFSSISSRNVGIRTTPSTSYNVYIAGSMYTDNQLTVASTFTANSAVVIKGALALSSTFSIEGNATFYKALYMYSGSIIYGYGSDGKYQACLWPRLGDITYLNYGANGFKLRNNSSTEIMVIDANDATTFKKNVTVSGTFSNPSSLVLKNVIDRDGLTLEQLSKIKPARFTWKDGRDKDVHLGGIADEMREVIPEAIHEKEDGTLTMEYGTASFFIAASLIPHVYNHDERLRILESEVKKLNRNFLN